MRKHINAVTILLVLIIYTSITNFIIYMQTGCTYGRWGYGSCGDNALILPSVTFLISIFCFVIYFRANKTRKKKTKEGRKF